MTRANQKAMKTGKPARYFQELRSGTRSSWSRERRVVAKVEHLTQGRNPRFVVASMGRKAIGAKLLYEDVYCARGDMENKEQKALPLR